MSEIRVDTVSEKTSANGVVIDSVTLKDGAFTATAGSTITVADNSDNLTLTSTDADASSGPNLRFYRNSSSPADGDDLSTIDFEGRNDNSQDVVYAQIKGLITDASDGTEDGKLELYHMFNGSLAPSLQLTTAGVVINESSNDIDFRVESDDNTHMLFVDGGNNAVGIGTSTIDAQVHILKNDSGALLDANADNLFIEDNTTGMTIGSSNSGEGHIRFSDSDDADVGAIGYFHSSNYMNFRVNGSERLRITSGGNFLVGTTDNSPAETNNVTGTRIGDNGGCQFSCSGIVMEINRDNSEGTLMSFRQAGGARGSISVGGSATAFNTSSDYRLKENVNYDWDATTRLKQLKPARFNWIADDTNTLVDGFLAHEVSDIVPEAILGKKDGMVEILYTSDDAETQGDNPTKNVGDFKEYSTTEMDPQQIDQSKLVPLMVKTIQELEARIKTLEDA